MRCAPEPLRRSPAIQPDDLAPRAACATIARVKIRLLAFATAAQALGAAAAERDVPEGSTVATLRDALAAESAALAICLARSAVAVDGALAAPETPLAAGCEVALLPPVSGG